MAKVDEHLQQERVAVSDQTTREDLEGRSLAKNNSWDWEWFPSPDNLLVRLLTNLVFGLLREAGAVETGGNGRMLESEGNRDGIDPLVDIRQNQVPDIAI